MTSKSIVVAMSGGVDSSVAAALLKQAGHHVIGMMLRLWSEPGSDGANRCCSPESMALARRVARQLDIPFYVIDARELFRSTVVDFFIDGYSRGVTPNPCLLCNRQVRWTYLLEHALAIGAEAMASGHYARKRKLASGLHELHRAVDRSKDQSYVLHVLDQNQLQRALFPIGELTKGAVRTLAVQFGLPTAQRRDSQDLCFLAGDDYRNFLRRNAPSVFSPGEIRTRSGRTVGRHEGLAGYTIGQRKGLGAVDGRPLYVLEKDSAENALIVGDAAERLASDLMIDNVNWIRGSAPEGPLNVEAKTRYTAKEARAVVMPLADGGAALRFDSPQLDLTPGQAAVFFQGDVVLGGGVIR